MAAYPNNLPLPQQSNYSLDPIPQVVMTDMEVGASRARRRTKTRQASLNVMWIFTEDQFRQFNDWFYADNTGISGGTSWFDIPLLTGRGSLATRPARFKDGAFKAALNGVIWDVSATLEIR